MPDASRQTARKGEDEGERLDRELIELLNELRVVIPGVQVLFGFLLTVPFQQRFGQIDDFQRIVYVVTLLLTAASAAFLMAPSAFHRLMFREGQKPYLIWLGTRHAIVGMLLLDVIFHTTTVALILVGTGVLFAWLWFGLALARRASGKREW